ncbi:MAG: hypothetical protein R3B07_18815 [Polyangiaceae bacterium]
MQSGRMDNSVVSGQADASAGILSGMGDLRNCEALLPGDRASSPACGAVVDLELAPLAQLCAGHNCAAQPAAPRPAPAPAVAPPAQPIATPVAAANTCSSDLPACQQRCEAGDSAACSALGNACALGFNLQACQLYWTPVVAMK